MRYEKFNLLLQWSLGCAPLLKMCNLYQVSRKCCFVTQKCRRLNWQSSYCRIVIIKLILSRITYSATKTQSVSMAQS